MLPVSMRPAPFSVVEEGWPLSEQIAKTAALRIECRDCRHKNALHEDHCQVSLTVAGWFSFSNHTLCLGSRVCCLLGVNSISIAGVQQLLGKRNSGNVTVHYTNSKNGYTKWFKRAFIWSAGQWPAGYQAVPCRPPSPISLNFCLFVCLNQVHILTSHSRSIPIETQHAAATVGRQRDMKLST